MSSTRSCLPLLLLACFATQIMSQRVVPGVNPQHYQQVPVQQQQYQQQQVPQHQQQQYQQAPQHHAPGVNPTHYQQQPVQQQPYQQVPQQQMHPNQQQQQMHPNQQQQQMHHQQPPQQMHQQQPPQQQHHGHHGQHQQVLNTANIEEERAHIQEHMQVPIDTSKMSEAELQFHYFKMHDSDNNNKLDGCELIKSLIHWHEQGHKDPNNPAPHVEEKVFSDEELVALIDPILQMDDTSKDGFIDYPEFIKAQQKAAAVALQQKQQQHKQQLLQNK